MSQSSSKAEIKIGVIGRWKCVNSMYFDLHPPHSLVAIQGDFDEHLEHFNALKEPVKAYLVKNETDLSVREYDALVLPGGESSTHKITMARNKAFHKTLVDMICNKKVPVWGTCCGLILLARFVDGVENKFEDGGIPCIDICVLRNAYGSQNDSFCRSINFDFGREKKIIEGLFIRAPAIEQVGGTVRVVASLNVGGKHHTVGAVENNVFVTCFHPELTGNLSIHEYFVEFALRRSS